MSNFVLDASVALRWFLDKSVPAYASQVRQQLIGGARALVPALWHLEMANALVVSERRRNMTAADLDLALREIELLVREAIQTDAVLLSVGQARATARSFNLTAYDATYLNLAKNEGLPLATLDEPLRIAAKQAGVQML